MALVPAIYTAVVLVFFFSGWLTTGAHESQAAGNESEAPPEEKEEWVSAGPLS